MSPLLVGLVLVLSDPVAALLVTAVLALAGSLGLAVAAVAEPARSRARTDRSVLGPLAAAQLRWVLLVLLVFGVALSTLELAVIARATVAGRPAAAGWLLAALSAGSAGGGLLWGRRPRRGRHQRQLLGLLTGLAAGTALAALAGSLLVLAAVLAISGLAVAPVFVVAYLAADRLSPPRMQTEATTWVATATNLGGAAGAAAAGALIEASSPRAALLVAAAGLGLAVLALAATPEWRRAEPVPLTAVAE